MSNLLKQPSFCTSHAFYRQTFWRSFDPLPTTTHCSDRANVVQSPALLISFPHLIQFTSSTNFNQPSPFKMFEAKLNKGVILKKILDAIKELVTEASWECTATGMSLQAMDTSHVSLVAVNLNGDGFQKFRCDRNMVLGMNLVNLSKVLKCSANDDKVTIKAADGDDKIKLMFEAPNESEVSEFNIKLMNLDSEYLGIPETEYNVTVKMPSSKFQRICRDLSMIGDAVNVCCTKNGVEFSASGDLGSGSVRLSQNSSVDKPEESVTISMQEAITQTFALKYLNQFAKATPLSSQVCLKLSPDCPLVVEYKVEETDEDDPTEIGTIRYYLAPKIDEDN